MYKIVIYKEAKPGDKYYCQVLIVEVPVDTSKLAFVTYKIISPSNYENKKIPVLDIVEVLDYKGIIGKVSEEKFNEIKKKCDGLPGEAFRLTFLQIAKTNPDVLNKGKTKEQLETFSPEGIEILIKDIKLELEKEEDLKSKLNLNDTRIILNKISFEEECTIQEKDQTIDGKGLWKFFKFIFKFNYVKNSNLISQDNDDKKKSL